MTLQHPAYAQLRQVTPVAAVMLEQNPSMYSLDGTNTWVLREPGADIVIAVDTQWQDSVNRDRDVDYVECSLPYSRTHYNRAVTLKRMTGDLPRGSIHGEWMGLLYLSARALPQVRAALHEMHEDPRHRKAKMPALLNRLAAAGQDVRVVYTSGNWLDVDSLEDVVNAAGF